MKVKRTLFCALTGALVAGTAVIALPAAAGAKTQKHPTAPTAITVISADTALFVSWSPPVASGTSPVSGYQTKVSKGKTCVSTGPTSCAITGLKNGFAYTVHVWAVNGSGHGQPARVADIPGTIQNCAYVGPDANLQGCNFSWTSLSGDDLTGANLTDAVLEGTSLTGATLTGARLAGADLQYVGSGAILGTPASLPTGWGLGGGYLFGPGNGVDWTDLTGIGTFPAADLTGASFTGSNLAGDDLSAVTSLESVGFEYTNLTGANLAGDDLTGADLTSADLSGADVTGATWSNTTCPDGSNSDSDGGTCVGYGI